MTNYDALKQMPKSSFANMVFSIVKYECDTLGDFEEFLARELSKEGEGILHELQHLQ